MWQLLRAIVHDTSKDSAMQHWRGEICWEKKENNIPIYEEKVTQVKREQQKPTDKRKTYR